MFFLVHYIRYQSTWRWFEKVIEILFRLIRNYIFICLFIFALVHNWFIHLQGSWSVVVNTIRKAFEVVKGKYPFEKIYIRTNFSSVESTGCSGRGAFKPENLLPKPHKCMYVCLLPRFEGAKLCTSHGSFFKAS